MKPSSEPRLFGTRRLQTCLYFKPEGDDDIFTFDFVYDPVYSLSDLYHLGYEHIDGLEQKLGSVMNEDFIRKFQEFRKWYLKNRDRKLKEAVRLAKETFVDETVAKKEAEASIAKMKAKVPPTAIEYWTQKLMPMLLVMTVIQLVFAVLFWLILPQREDGSSYRLTDALYHCVCVATKASSVTQRWLTTQNTRFLAVVHMLLTFASLLSTIDDVQASIWRRNPYVAKPVLDRC